MKIKSRRVPENTQSHEKNRTPAHSLPRPRLVYALPQPDGEVVDSQRPLKRRFQESAQKPAALIPPNTNHSFSFIQTFALQNHEKIIRIPADRCHHEFLLPSAKPVMATQEEFQRLAHQKEKVLTQTKTATPPGCGFCLRAAGQKNGVLVFGFDTGAYICGRHIRQKTRFQNSMF